VLGARLGRSSGAIGHDASRSPNEGTASERRFHSSSDMTTTVRFPCRENPLRPFVDSVVEELSKLPPRLLHLPCAQWESPVHPVRNLGIRASDVNRTVRQGATGAWRGINNEPAALL